MRWVVATVLAFFLSGGVQAQDSLIDQMNANPDIACDVMAGAYSIGVGLAAHHDTMETVVTPEGIHPKDVWLFRDLAGAGLTAMLISYNEAKAQADAETGDFAGKVVVPDREVLADFGGIVYEQLTFACKAARNDLAVIAALPYLPARVLEYIGELTDGQRGFRNLHSPHYNNGPAVLGSFVPVVATVKEQTSGPEEDAWYGAFRLRAEGCITHNWDIWIRSCFSGGKDAGTCHKEAVDKALVCMDVEKPARFKEDYLGD